MVTLRVSKNILGRLMNIYTHQTGAGNYTGYGELHVYFRLCLSTASASAVAVFLIFQSADRAKRTKDTRTRKREQFSVVAPDGNERIPAGNNPAGDTDDYTLTC